MSQDPEEMSFFDHLEELRWHLMRSVIAIVIAAVVLFMYRVEVIGGVFMAPFRYDFVTYQLLCKYVSTDFCPPAEATAAYFSARQDTLVIEGVMDMPVTSVAGDSGAKAAVVTKPMPVKLRVDARKFMESGQMAGLKVQTEHGEMVAMQATTPYEQFMKALLYAFFAGLIVAFPYVSWEIWKFIRPALSPKEARRVRWNVLSTSLLFFVGVAFGYFVILPTSLLFLAQFVLFEQAQNIWRIGDVINFELVVLFGAGLIFQLPLVIYYLSLIGLVTPEFLRKYRRHSIVALLVVAALITPSPDPVSQMMVFGPLMILYEVSILISARVARRKAREAEEERAADLQRGNPNAATAT